jgi:hypothetical protein
MGQLQILTAPPNCSAWLRAWLGQVRPHTSQCRQQSTGGEPLYAEKQAVLCGSRVFDGALCGEHGPDTESGRYEHYVRSEATR